jgi:hypothetical protein
MNTQLTNILTGLSKAEMTNLTNQVKETISTIGANTQQLKFGVADLWKIQKTSKTTFARRRSNFLY